MAVFLISGCTHSPEAVVKTYLDYTFLDNNGEDAYKLLSSDDKAYISQEHFTREIRKKNILNKKVLEKYEEYFQYEVVGSHDQGDTIYVTVEISKPNAFNVLSDLVGYAMVTAFGSLPEADRMQAITQKFEAIMMSKDRLLVSEEKTFKVLKEEDGYKLFLNLGEPEKARKNKEQAKVLISTAWENERTINFEKAVQYYSEALKLSYDENLKKKISELKDMQNKTLSVGQVKAMGNLRFEPQKIEKRPVWIKKIGDGKSEPKLEMTDKEYLVLTFSAKNISEGQVFAIEDEGVYKTENQVIDNYGNLMKELQPEIYTDEIEGKKYCKLLPGECKTYKAICEAPLTDLSEKFMWKIKLNTDNSGKKEMAFIGFTRDDFENQELLARN